MKPTRCWASTCGAVAGDGGAGGVLHGGPGFVGLKLALPIGVFTGLAVFVPYLGFGLGLVLGLMAAVLQSRA